MKKKFGLFALVLAVLLCGSLFLLAACDETEEDPADTPATISVTVNGTAQTSGGTYSATVGTAYTFAATASNGNAVTISYVFGDAEAVTLEGTSFTPETAGSYAFTFTAEDAANFTLTLVAAAEVPPAPQYTVTYELGGHAAADAQAPTEQTVAEDTQITLAAAVEAAEGYAFGGWNDGTTTYEAGATYTVTGNVTMTAVWNVVHTHTYTWEVTQVPTDSARGSATGTCSGCEAGTDGHTKTVTLPKVIGVDEPNSNLIEGTVPESGAQVGKYYVTVTNPTCTADAGMAFSYVYDAETVIPFTYTVEGTALGHAYVVEYDSATMTSAGWTATATCDRSGCGATHEFTNVPAVDSKDTDNWSETSKIDYEGQMPTCTTDGKTALAYKIAAPDGGVLIVKNVPIPALGHAYEISYEDGSVKADCLKCESVYSATVTISGGEDATGNTVLAAENFAFNAETNVFTVTLPQNAFEKDGFTFSGWLVGGETYTAGQTVTVAAGNTLEIVAQWTAVNVPLISLSVTVYEGKEYEKQVPTVNGGSIGGADSELPVCVNTVIVYAVTVTNGGDITPVIKYTLDGAEEQTLSVASGSFTFESAGTYKFTITADSAQSYTYTVIVTEHDYERATQVIFDKPSDSASGKLMIYCLKCNDPTEGHSIEVILPVLTEKHVTDSYEEGKYTVKTDEATCTESGSATYIYNIPSEYGGGTIEAATVTLPQLEHSLTFTEAQEATCTADGHSAYAYCSTCQKYFAVTEGSTESDFTITGDPLNDTTSFVIAATGHSGTYAYDAEKQAVVFACGECSTTIDCEITGLTVTGDAASAYVVDNGDGTYTAYGFTVEAVYTSVDDNPVTEITIPLDDENLAVTAVSASGGYGNSTVTFTYTKTEGTVSDATDNAIYTVYASAAEAGEVTASGFTPYAVSLGTLSGTGEYRFSITMTSRTSYGVYNSWLVTLDPLNEAKADAAIRPDNYILTNFGRGNGQGQAETTAEDFSYTADILSGRTFLNGWTADDTEGEPTTPTGEPTGALDFVILRTFSNGRYTTKVTVTQGTDSAVMTLTEPAAIGNEVRVYLGTDCANYTYTEVLKAQSGIGSVTSIVPSQSAVTVPGGTTLDEVLAIVDVTVNYSGVTLADLKAATECDPQCKPTYSADTDGTYTVTLTYGGQTAQIAITVDADHVHNFVDGVCDGCWARSVTADGYSGVLTPVAIANDDHGTAWWAGTTSDITMADNSAVVLTWENARDENYFDYVIEGVFNLGGMQGTTPDGQYIDFDQASERTAEWESVTAPTMSGSYTSGTFTPAGTANAGYGSYVATITRIGTTVTVTVEFTPDASTGVQAWTRTATATNCPTGSNMLLHIAGNPFFLDNITAHYGTMAQA